MNAVFPNDVFKKPNFFLVKFQLIEVDLKEVFLKLLKDKPDVLVMFLWIFAVDKDVVKVDFINLVDVVP